MPQGWATNPQLGNWVKKQRAAKRRLDRGDDTPGITEEQVEALEALGFEWELHTSSWEALYAELEAFRAQHGHCNVPRGHISNGASLGTWVDNQRTAKRRRDKGDRYGGISQERIDRLLAIDFKFILRAL